MENIYTKRAFATAQKKKSGHKQNVCMQNYFLTNLNHNMILSQILEQN